MASSQKSVWVVATIGFLLALGIYVSLPQAVHRVDLEKSLTQACESRGVVCGYQSLSLKTFPTVRFVLESPEIRFKSRPIALKAEKIIIPLRFPEFLWGRYEPSSAEVRDGSLSVGFKTKFWEAFHIEHLSFKLGSIRRRSLMRFNLEGDLQGVAKSLKARGKISMTQFEKWQPSDIFLESTFELSQFDLKSLIPGEDTGAGWKLKSGKSEGEFTISKARDTSVFAVQGKAAVSDFAYQMLRGQSWADSAPARADLDLNFEWDFRTGEALFHHSLLKLPFGSMEATGSFFTIDRSFKSLHLSVNSLSLDMIPQYYLPFKEAIPFNVGFSGASNAEVSLEGKWDDLALHATWDMTPALWTYAPYFSKPKDVPLTSIFDLKWKNLKDLSGDFSLSFQEAVIKGAVSNLDFSSGEGELNIITNKFSLVGWDRLLIPLQNFAVGGDIKVLANFKGNLLRAPNQAKVMANFTLENGALSKGTEYDIKNVFLTVDYAPISMEVKQLRFQVRNSPVIASIMVYHPLQQPLASIKINSPRMSPMDIAETLEHLAAEAWPKTLGESFKQFRQSLDAALPAKEDFTNVVSEMEYKENVLAVKSLQFRYCGGETSWKGEYRTPEKKYSLESQVDHLSLARFFSDIQSQTQQISGDFFMTGKLQGDAAADWQQKISGDGGFSITQGALANLDLLSAVSKIQGLGALEKYVSGQTKFDDLRGSFEVREGKVSTRRLDLMGRDLNAKADGQISLLDGALNYRLDVFLPGAVAAEVLGNWDDISEKNQDKQLGPIPFLLAGPFARLELSTNPELFPQFQENFQKRKTHKVLSNFLPEDFLLKRPASS